MKVIFSDVDNTLVVRETGVTETLVKAIKHCQDKDIEFVMCSGRPTNNLINVANELKNHDINLNYVVGYNGAEIFDLNKELTIKEESLSLLDVDKITKVLHELSVDFILYQGSQMHVTNPDSPYILNEQDNVKLEIVKLERNFASNKILGVVAPEMAKEIEKKLQETLPDYTITLSTPTFIEITKKNVDKLSGLNSMLEILKVDLEDVICCGDGGNDYTMLAHAKNAIAVENATDEIKSVCNIHVKSASEDGVSHYILNNL